jgi:hypothetical protein
MKTPLILDLEKTDLLDQKAMSNIFGASRTRTERKAVAWQPPRGFLIWPGMKQSISTRSADPSRGYPSSGRLGFLQVTGGL